MRRFATILVAVGALSLTAGGYAQTPSPPVAAKMSPQQAQILADAQKLHKLSQELKVEVDKSSKDTLSLSIVRKAQEVEKLAKSLKEEISKSH